MKHIHLGCLREWFEGKKLIKETDYYVSLAWENLACELCKSPYPDVLWVVDKSKTEDGEKKAPIIWTIDVINVPRPHENVPYVILNCLNVNTLKRENSKIIYIVYFIVDEITMGRGHEANVRIADISISRRHAKFLYHENGLWLEDDDSKFGTVLLQQWPIQM